MRQVLRFLGAGGAAAALQFAVMTGLVRGLGVAAVTASAAGFVCGALLNYQLNRTYTFTSTTPHRTALGRFAVMAGMGLLINAASMFVLVDVFAVHYLPAQAVAMAVVLVWNFCVGKRWTFASGD